MQGAIAQIDAGLDVGVVFAVSARAELFDRAQTVAFGVEMQRGALVEQQHTCAAIAAVKAHIGVVADDFQLRAIAQDEIGAIRGQNGLTVGHVDIGIAVEQPGIGEAATINVEVQLCLLCAALIQPVGPDLSGDRDIERRAGFTKGHELLDIQATAGHVERAAGAEIKLVNRAGAAEVDVVAAQIDAVASDQTRQILRFPVQAVVPADAVAQIIWHEADGFRVQPPFYGDPEARLEIGDDQVCIDHIVQLTVSLRTQGIGQIRDRRVRVAQKLLGEVLNGGGVQRVVVQPVGVDARGACAIGAHPVMDDGVIIVDAVILLEQRAVLYRFGGLLGGVVGIRQMGDDVVEQGCVLATVVNATGHRAVEPVDLLVAARGDDVVGEEREVPHRAVALIDAAQQVHGDVVVEEHVVLHKATAAHMGPKGCAAHDDVVAQGHVPGVRLNIEVVVEHDRVLAVAAFVIGGPAIVVKGRALDQDAAGVHDQRAGGMAAIGDVEGFIDIGDFGIAERKALRGAHMQTDQVAWRIGVIGDADAVENDVLAVVNLYGFGDFHIADHHIVGAHIEAGVQLCAQHRVGPRPVGGDVDRVQRAFAFSPGDLQCIATEPVIFIAALELQPVRGRLRTGAGDLVPDAHAGIQIEGHVLAAAILRVGRQPFASDLTRADTCHLGNIVDAERAVALRDEHIAVVVAGLDDQIALGIGFQLIQLTVAPAGLLGGGAHIDVVVEHLCGAVRVGHLVAHAHIAGELVVHAHHKRQRVVRVYRQVAVAWAIEHANACDIVRILNFQRCDTAAIDAVRA